MATANVHVLLGCRRRHPLPSLHLRLKGQVLSSPQESVNHQIHKLTSFLNRHWPEITDTGIRKMIWSKLETLLFLILDMR